jgi:hypothetical protein
MEILRRLVKRMFESSLSSNDFYLFIMLLNVTPLMDNVQSLNTAPTSKSYGGTWKIAKIMNVPTVIVYLVALS